MNEYEKHTPGPWYPVDNGYFWDINTDDQLHSTSIRNGCHVFDKANARLIGGAPDLLEALELVVTNHGSSLWTDKALAAIAKATGGVQ